MAGGSKDELLFGKHPVLEALQAGRMLEKVFLQKGLNVPEVKQIGQLCRQRLIPVQYVPIQKLNSISRKIHQGVIAYASLIDYYEIDDIVAQVYDNGEVPLFLLLDGVTDVRNMGAIARTALCMGAHALILPQKGGAIINADAMKASAGALNKLSVCRVRELQDAMDNLSQHGIKVAAAAVDGEVILKELDFNIPLGILLGSEGDGVDEKLMDKADSSFQIPMSGDFDSLNVSVSVGLILYECLRQRTA